MSEIMEFIPAERHTCLFSATVPLGIRGLIHNYLKDPKWVSLSEDFAYVREVRHTYIIAPAAHKERVLYKIIELDQPTSSMIFCNTRNEVRSVSAFLARQGLPVAMISSDLTQQKREQVMAGFRTRKIRHLVATDVAARGIDIEELSHVFIYSTPDSPEDYIHRAGRTGRVGRAGVVVSLVAALDLVNFNRLVKRYHIDVGELDVPSDEQVEERKLDRIVTRLAAEGQSLPMEDYAELAPISKRIASDEYRDRIVSLLLRSYLQPPARDDDLEDDEPPPRRHSGDGRGRGRSRSRSGPRRRG